MGWEELKGKLTENGWTPKTETIYGETYEDLILEDGSTLFRVSPADKHDRAETTVQGWDEFKAWFKDWAWDIW